MNVPDGSRWTIVEVGPARGRNKNRLVHVRCACGTEKWIQLDGVLKGRSKSCGCLPKDTAGPRLSAALTKHGEHGSRLYRIWKGMRERCRYPKHVSWARYGGRGIKVAMEWNDYATFRDWALTNGYANDLTIDRIDNDGDYEPSNCRWITKSENSRRLPQQRSEAAERMEAILS